MTIFIISIAIFASLIIYNWFVKKNGIQPSLSSTYKLMHPIWKDEIWLLVFAFLGFGLLCLHADYYTKASAIGLTIVGCKPEYWKKEEGQKHVFGAYLVYIPLVARMFTQGSFWFTVACLLVVLVLLVSLQFKIKGEKRPIIQLNNKTTFIELVLFVVPVLALYFTCK